MLTIAMVLAASSAMLVKHYTAATIYEDRSTIVTATRPLVSRGPPVLTIEVSDRQGRPVDFYATISMPAANGSFIHSRPARGHGQATIELTEYAEELSRLLDSINAAGKRLQKIGILVLLTRVEMENGKPVVVTDAFTVPISLDVLKPGYHIKAVHKFTPKAKTEAKQAKPQIQLAAPKLDLATSSAEPTVNGPCVDYGFSVTCYYWELDQIVYPPSGVDNTVNMPFTIVDVAPSNGVDSPAQKTESVIVSNIIRLQRYTIEEVKIGLVVDFTLLGGSVTIPGPAFVDSIRNYDTSIKTLLDVQCTFLNTLNSLPGSKCTLNGIDAAIPDYYYAAYLATGAKGRLWIAKYNLIAETCDLDGICYNENIGSNYAAYFIPTYNIFGYFEPYVEVQDDYYNYSGYLYRVLGDLRSKMETATILSGYYNDRQFNYYSVIVDVNEETYMSVSLPVGSVAAIVSRLNLPMAATTLSFTVTSSVYYITAYGSLSALTIDVETSVYPGMQYNSEVLKTGMMVVPDNGVFTIPLLALRP